MADLACDVAVVGAGPVGMTLANLLGSYGISTLVLEGEPALFDLPRAVGTDSDCLRAWQAVGLSDRLLADMIPSGRDGTGLVYQDRRRKPFLEIRPDRRPYGFAEGYSFIQPRVDRVLLEGLARYPEVQLRFGHRVEHVEQSPAHVQIEGRLSSGEPFRARARYAVACDGGRSPLRRALGIDMRGPRFAQRWLVLDTLEPEPSDRNLRDVEIVCDSERPSVSVPRLHGHRRFEFRARPEESDEELLDPHCIRALLAAYAPPQEIRILRKVVHTFRAQIATRFRAGRVFLAGDAAHVTPPFAAQGLAIGIRDAFNLGWKLAMVIRGAAAETLLESYQRERRPHATASVRLALRLGILMTPRSRLQATLVPRILRQLLRIPALHRYLREAGPKPPARYRRGFFVPGKGVAGWMLHQPEVLCQGGRRAALDDVLGSSFALLGFGFDPLRMLEEADREFWTRLPTRFLEVLPRTSSAACQKGQIRDFDGKLESWLGDLRERLLLVRPDRFVALDCRLREASLLLQSLQRGLETRSA